VTGAADIAEVLPADEDVVRRNLFGVVFGLMAAVAVGGVFITAEYSPRHYPEAVQVTKHVDQLPIGPWAGLGLRAAYAGAAVAASYAAFRRRDV
jgi:hypothetical protein